MPTLLRPVSRWGAAPRAAWGFHSRACRPYVERFTGLPGCGEATLPVDPFDVRWGTVRQVIALLST